MQFTIVQSKTTPPVNAFIFQPPGGTIGRSLDNDLVLPDEKRTISRLQALVHIAPDGECHLTNCGSVITVLLNNQRVERHSRVSLQHGDRLRIGDYLIEIACLNKSDTAVGAVDPLSLFSGETDANAEAPASVVDADMASAIPPAAPAGRGSKQNDARLNIDPPPQTEAATASTPGKEQEQKLQALLEGMGLDISQSNAPLSEEQIRMTGRLLSLFAQGTVALLSSRSILKRGVKAEMTMIFNEANNPFKILPSGKTVLMQMYQSQMPGFMEPEQAVRDALVDLQAHQLGMIAGIRAIIAAILQSFNPQHLETKARKEGMLPRLGLSLTKKAAMWDYFMHHYQRTAGEIEDDFHTLFGEAFLHAYDVEVNQYKDSQTRAEET